MKELSIEQKARSYDEALEKAKDFYKGYKQRDNQLYANDLETIFPELRESEDERIREEIISIVKSYRESCITEGNHRFEDCIAWLEKQKEPELSEDLGEYVTELNKQFPEVSFAKLSRIAVRVKNWLEKQGEQKSIWHNEYEEPQRDSLILLIMQSGTPIVAKIIEPNHTFNHGEKWAYIDDLLEKQGNLKSDEWKEGDVVRHGGVLALVTNGRRAIKSNLEQITIQYPDEWVKAETKERKYFFDELEKQDKQQPADKLEPKFHEGEWVTNGDYTWKIVEVKPLDYILQSQDGNVVDDTISHVDEQFHSFTIEDAKDGDVLCYKDEISLYKHDIKNCTKQETTFGGFVYHCCYDGKRFITDSLYSLTEQDKIDIHPATKEQRDTLERAITNAGYRWDREKLKLEKI